MSSKNLQQTQRLFGDLSIKTKSTNISGSSASSPSSPLSPSPSSCNGAKHCSQAAGRRSSAAAAGSTTNSSLQNTYKDDCPEIHDLIRFQKAIMLRFHQTQDPHFKNIADALKPQIEEKIRDFHRRN